ncbi:Rossmann-like and DUF2520 domain-containing protein [Knoellia sp. Soil729]|uniref:Rossmann-like and DUF2520 domain-containing protein n=1 Tax=Knoellia sp. Soil729 TaxID=1736394 RepID=UPI0006F98D95|nr:DUF2520 domain-containing protein [Knoellia sp. Soil729]KRE42386.1 NADH-ubiquinone oxidoreductase [Knoellia sp. Soil729]
MTHPARLSIGLIGAGRVGAVLAAALARAGHHIQAAYAVSDASRERAAALLPGVPLKDVPGVIDGADLVLLAVPDDALPELVSGLTATDTWQAGQIVVHTSGRYGADVLRPALGSHILPVAIHPAMTFTGTALDLGRLEDCAFGVTGPEALRPMAEALVVEMGGEPVWVAEGQRAAYHAALAHGSNHLVTLVAEAMEVLVAAGVEQPRAVLGPLARAALDNALRLGDAALTGPVARGDVSTVGTHLRELERISPEIRTTYVALARATAVRALESGRLQSAAAEPLLDTLADPEHQEPAS